MRSRPRAEGGVKRRPEGPGLGKLSLDETRLRRVQEVRLWRASAALHAEMRLRRIQEAR